MSSKSLRTVFFGTPEFALESLHATFENTNLLAVVSQPDRPRGRGQNVSPCEVRGEALKLGIATHAPTSLKKDSSELSALLSELDRLKPDLFVVTAYGNLLPQKFLDFPSLGAINVHASLLPRWRGAAPIQRCIEAGDKVSGVSIQKMVMEMDAGDVLSEEKMQLSQNIDALTLSAALSKMGGALLAKLLKSVDSKSLPQGKRQNLDALSFAQKIKKEEGLWTPDWGALESNRRIRAFKAWPGVRAKVLDSEFKFIETEVLENGPKLMPGELAVEGSTVYLTCVVRSGETAATLKISKVQPANRSVVDAAAFFQNLIEAGQPSLRVLKVSQ